MEILNNLKSLLINYKFQNNKSFFKIKKLKIFLLIYIFSQIHICGNFAQNVIVF